MVRYSSIKIERQARRKLPRAILTGRILLFLLIILTPFLHAFKKADEVTCYRFSGFAQGTSYHVTYYHHKNAVRQYQIDSILAAIDSSLSIYKDYSLITAFNRSETGIDMDTHLRAVVERSLEISKKSHGAFDITVYPLVEAWGFGLKDSVELPTHKQIKELLKNVGYQHLKVKSNQLIKAKPGIKIDVNGIAQGYSVDVIASFLEKQGIHNYIAELGGELRVKGRKPGNQLFKVGIEAVNDQNFKPLKKYIEIDKGAITTSGNYRKFHEQGAKLINHLINPKTGYNNQNNLISVTVYAQDAITADGYDNVLMTLGLEKSLRFLMENKHLSAYFVYKEKGIIKDTCSLGFPEIKGF